MFGLGKKASPAGRLAPLLRDYPPFGPLHHGHNIRSACLSGPVLTSEQLRDNFEAYRAALPARIDALGSLLQNFNLELGTAYEDTSAFVSRLHPLLLAELPPLYRPELAKRSAWELSNREGGAIVLSFLADLAMLNADILVRAKPGAFLGMNLDPADKRMFSYGRPCLLGLGDSLYPDAPPSVYYLEEEWFGYYANMDDPARLAPPTFTPVLYPRVIGGTMLARLDRDIPHPNLAELRRSGWLAEAD